MYVSKNFGLQPGATIFTLCASILEYDRITGIAVRTQIVFVESNEKGNFQKR